MPARKDPAAKKESKAPEVETRRVVQISYDDGSVEEVFAGRPSTVLALERRYGVHTPSTFEHMLFAAWFALGSPGEDLDSWVNTVEDLDFIDREKAPKAAS